MDKVNAFGERLMVGGAEVGRKMSAGMNSMSFKVRELLKGSNPAEKLVEEATSDTIEEPNWSQNLDACDLLNNGKINSIEFIRAIKKRIMLKNPRVQYLALMLLETCVKNYWNGFSEVAAERVLDEMVKLIDDPQTVVCNRNKALMLIESWGESTSELRYLPVYEETYKSLKSRGIRFPGRDDESLAPIFTPPRSVSKPEVDALLAQKFEHLTTEPFTAEQAKQAFDVARNCIELLNTVLSSSPHEEALQDDLTGALVQQCYQSQATVQRIIETAGDNEALLFEALNVNDDIQKALAKYDDLKDPLTHNLAPNPRVLSTTDGSSSPSGTPLMRKPVSRGPTREGSSNDMMNDLDEMIFGGRNDDSYGVGQNPQKSKSGKDDLISF